MCSKTHTFYEVTILPAAKLDKPRFSLVFKAKDAVVFILYRKQGIVFCVIALCCTNGKIIETIILHRRDKIIVGSDVAHQSGMLILQHTSVHAVGQIVRDL